MKPVIGICATPNQDPRLHSLLGIGTKDQEMQILASDYTRAVEKAGGIPVILPIQEDADSLIAWAKTLDGFLFSGGADLDPAYYGEDAIPALGPLVPERDRQEMALAKALLVTQMPILGICRGHQLLNVAMGGSLYQDLPSQHVTTFNHSGDEEDKALAIHEVDIIQGSLQEKIFGCRRLPVNSFHHQAIKETAPGLRATMMSPDKIIEGTEGIARPHLVTVQWHPEMMIGSDDRYLAVFNWLIQVAQE